MSVRTLSPCAAVFRFGVNTPVTCALRLGHVGPHRTWGQVADDRAEMMGSLRTIRDDYDHDGDAHRYSTICRCCEAERVLALVEGGGK